MTPDLLGALLDALADRIAERIGSTRERKMYSSVDLPPRTTRRRFRELCARGSSRAPDVRGRPGFARARAGRLHERAVRRRPLPRARRRRSTTAPMAF